MGGQLRDLSGFCELVKLDWEEQKKIAAKNKMKTVSMQQFEEFKKEQEKYQTAFQKKIDRLIAQFNDELEEEVSEYGVETTEIPPDIDMQKDSTAQEHTTMMP